MGLILHRMNRFWCFDPSRRSNHHGEQAIGVRSSSQLEQTRLNTGGGVEAWRSLRMGAYHRRKRGGETEGTFKLSHLTRDWPKAIVSDCDWMTTRRSWRSLWLWAHVGRDAHLPDWIFFVCLLQASFHMMLNKSTATRSRSAWKKWCYRKMSQICAAFFGSVFLPKLFIARRQQLSDCLLQVFD